MSTKYNHVEAFCLMRYESNDHTVVEYLWNSRDGVTPFCIHAKDGQTELEHVNWNSDERRETHKPMPGDRIFIDLTLEQAKVYRGHQWDRWYKDPTLVSELIATYQNKHTFVAKTTLQQGEPDVHMVSNNLPPTSI